MKKLNKKAFTMLETLTTIMILAILLSTSLTSELMYTQDKAKNISQVETFSTLAKDIKMNFEEDTTIMKVSNFYITLKDNQSGCYYSYYYNKNEHTLEKIVDLNCAINLSPFIRTVYKDKIYNVLFTDLGNGSIKFEANDLNEPRSNPFTFYFSKPNYVLN